MGQYFMIVNESRREFLHPHKLGMGLKLWEICANKGAGVLVYLMRKSDELGGGDIESFEAFPNAGRWAGDRVVVIGDYDSSNLWDEVRGEAKAMNEQIPYKDISLEIRNEYEKFLGEKLNKRWDK